MAGQQFRDQVEEGRAGGASIVAPGAGAPSVWRRIGGVGRLLHPFPSLMNTVATLLFATLAFGGVPGARTAVLLAGAIFGSQAAIGSANDLADRELDRA